MRSPSSFSIRTGRSGTTRGSAGCGYASIVPGTSRAPHSSTISRAARRCAAIASSGCSCFSNRADASVRSPSAFDVRMMFGPTHVAASIRTRVVLSDTSEISPPMTPAIPLGPSASQTSAISPVKVRSAPSRVVIVSPSPARRTTIWRPRTSSRSNACSGWPTQSIT